jgi:nitroreductase
MTNSNASGMEENWRHGRALLYDSAMRLNEKLSILWGRRSIRAYANQPVPDELVADLLSAAMAAPSAGAKDPWRFVVVKDRAMLRRMAEALPHGRMLAGAGVGIVVCGDLAAAHDGQLSYVLQDCSAAIENLLIAAHALGLGACWLGVHPREARVEAMRTLLGIPAAVVPVSAVALGYPAEQKEPRTRYDARHVHTEHW